MYYVGYNKTTRIYTVFTSKHKPTPKSHGFVYAFVFGGYRTRKEANDVKGYQSPWWTVDMAAR